MENLPANLTDKYSFFDNEYLLTKEMCSEAEISRIDTGLIIAWILFTFMLFMMMPVAPAMINDYFSAPSMGTILSLSGGVGITILPSFAAVILLVCCRGIWEG